MTDFEQISKAIEILRKYGEEGLAAEHDMIFFHCSPAVVSKEDIIALHKIDVYADGLEYIEDLEDADLECSDHFYMFV